MFGRSGLSSREVQTCARFEEQLDERSSVDMVERLRDSAQPIFMGKDSVTGLNSLDLDRPIRCRDEAPSDEASAVPWLVELAVIMVESLGGTVVAETIDLGHVFGRDYA